MYLIAYEIFTIIGILFVIEYEQQSNSSTMEPRNISREMLEEELKKIQNNGIQSDRQHLKRNMYTQFSDPFEFAREYVVNSYDAMATACYISGRETKNTVTITIRDNGKGMDHQRIQDYFKIFRSRKDNPEIQPIGHFGVGKMSVAAIPGLLRFACSTSTGEECWRFETDSLVDDQPVTLERLEPVPPMGTKFEITFRKTTSLADLLVRIYGILYKYVRHLDIDIYFDLAEVDKDNNPVQKKLTTGNWLFDPDNLGKAYTIFLNGAPVEVIMGLGNAEHEIYQNRVYITSIYNLVSFGQKEINIPNLRIRVNSEAFELTFGRHCLSNETVLKELSYEIRCKILPKYFEYLTDHFSEDFVVGSPELADKIEEMTCRLIEFNPECHSWSSFQLFRTYDMHRFSFKELKMEIEKSGLLYIEARDNEGADYSMFNAPVLNLEQPKGGLDVLQKLFAKNIVNLNETDVVIEAPLSPELTLSAEEKHFELFLVFKLRTEVLDHILKSLEPGDSENSSPKWQHMDALEESVGICEEARIVERDVNSIIWKVNYLLERDGISPCRSRKFMYKEGKVVLNLYHSEIREFIELSCIDAKLAAHWAMAMCLSDMKLLSHITPEAREDLLLMDAMGRLDCDFTQPKSPVNKDHKEYLDFLRNCN